MSTDRYRYFRIEADELLTELTKGVLELERSGATADAVKRLLRFAHTFKGAARVVKQSEIAEHAHAIEDVLEPYREAGGNLDRSSIDRLLASLDAIRNLTAALGPATTAAAPAAPLPQAGAADAETARPTRDDDAFQSVRLDLAQIDEVLLATARVGAAAERIAAAAAASSELASDREELARELADLRERVFRLRLLPVEALFDDLRRAIRDAAATLGKAVDVQLNGGDVRLEAQVLAALRAALLHVVRNCVAHGIEDAATRAARGKNPAGRVSITIARTGHRAVVTVTDDGGGIDAAAIREAAVERGFVTADAARDLGQGELVELLLRGGLSTSRNVTEVAGRGVGLEVVSDTIRRLKGELDVRSTSGAGTTVELKVPVSLAAMPALAVDAGGEAVLIPLDTVRATVRVDAARLSEAANGETFLWNDRPLPFVPLARVLDGGAAAAAGEPRSAVVVRGPDGELALGVDRVRDVRDIVVQQLPRHATANACVAGVAFDYRGVPGLVFAPTELDPAEVGVRSARAERAAPARPPPVLVIDESLTTRMLEQTILEAAGYEVDLAVSAEEALEKAARRRYGLFIVDVEMPGMSGFEFVSRTRADAALADIPCILVTSRNAPEDKRRGEEAGAAAYFVKSEFNQDALLATMRRLLA